MSSMTYLRVNAHAVARRRRRRFNIGRALVLNNPPALLWWVGQHSPTASNAPRQHVPSTADDAWRPQKRAVSQVGPMTVGLQAHEPPVQVPRKWHVSPSQKSHLAVLHPATAEYGPADIGCRLMKETRAQMRADDVATSICQALPRRAPAPDTGPGAPPPPPPQPRPRPPPLRRLRRHQRPRRSAPSGAACRRRTARCTCPRPATPPRPSAPRAPRTPA